MAIQQPSHYNNRDFNNLNMYGEMEKLFPDKYSLYARWYPSALLSLPFAAFIYPIGKANLDFMQSNLLCDIVGIVSSFVFCSSAMIVFYSDYVRNLGRKLQLKHFQRSQRLPTTEFLLWSNSEFSDERKSLLHQAIKEDFNIKLLDKREEGNDEPKARQIIGEAVDLIRPKIKDGVHLLQYNIRFGFIRNLAAGSRAIGLPASLLFVLLSLIWLHNQACLIVESVLAGFYLWRVIKTEEMLDFFGEEYARVLFAEYLNNRKFVIPSND